MPQTIQLRPEMGRDIVRHLSQFAELPRKGVLAGQAVDSAITDLWLGGGGVYNDLDVFRQCPFQADRPERKANQTAMRSSLQAHRRQGYGGIALVLETVDTYGIASVSRQGMLNHVNCFMASGKFGQKLTAHRVLSGFDLNCVRVGVDLETGALYWDRHYQEFQASRQLKVAMMHTPWHTLVRLAKKREELPNVYADMALTAEACASVAQSDYIGQMLRDRDVSLMFGSKMLAVAQQYSSVWAPYFSMDSVVLQRPSTNRSGESWQEQREPQEVLRPDQVRLWRMRALGDVDSAVQARINKLGKGSLFFAFQTIEEMRRRKNNQVYVKLEALRQHRQAQGGELLRDHVLQHLDFFDTAYVQGQALPAVSDKVEAFFKKHSAFAGLLMGESLARQWEAIQRIKRVVRRFSDEFTGSDTEAPYGVLETQASSSDLLDDDTMWRLLVEDHRRQSAPFTVKPLQLPKLPARWKHYLVEELLTPAELQREGATMQHCVGGYAHAVRSGRSRILRLRHPSERKAWSTAELRPSSRGAEEEPTVEVVQHRAKSNQTPHPDNETLLQYIVAMLNLPRQGREQAQRGLLLPWATAHQHALKMMVTQLERTLSRLQRMAQNVQERLRKARKDLDEADAMLSAAQYHDTMPSPSVVPDAPRLLGAEAALREPLDLSL